MAATDRRRGGRSRTARVNKKNDRSNDIYFHPICYLRSSFSLPPMNSRDSDPGSHSRLFSPLPTTVRASHFYRHKTSALSPFDGARRIEPTQVRRSRQLILFYFRKQISPRWDLNSRTNTTVVSIVAFDGNHY